MTTEESLALIFADIFKKQERPLYLLAFRLTKSHQQAKDIIQDVFLKLWEDRYRMSEIKNMEAWLYTLTENKIIDFLRKKAAENRLKATVEGRIAHMLDETEDRLHSKESNQIIRKAIDQLPPQRKLIYQLNRDADLSYQQIAQQLRISKHTVKNQLSSAVQQIRSFFKKNIKLF